jgi:deoxyadenosine/deoxycytidine kinase
MAESGAPASPLLAVAGNLGAGKTTLVNGLCRHLGWQRCPLSSPAPSYVERIHADPKRWSFEAQLNFLVLKASGLRAAAVAHQNIVVDRTIYEDRDIMARSWAERYWDDASWRTYDECADLLVSDLPVPDAVIFCRCDLPQCEERRRARPRSYQARYDSQWVERLDELYDEWLEHFQECPLLQVDTERHDLRNLSVVADIVADIADYFAPARPDQAPLFDLYGAPMAQALFEPGRQPSPLRILTRLNDLGPVRSVDFPLESKHTSSVSIAHPAVYIAAPFTSVAAAPEPLANDLRLPVGEGPHGIIPKGYRALLQQVAEVFEQDGIQAVLPHRDVNVWGNRTLTARDVAASCLESIRRCDAFVGLLGQSFGVHAEAGMALALTKKCVLVEVAELGDTFIGRGLARGQGVTHLAVDKIADVPAALIAANVTAIVRP